MNKNLLKITLFLLVTGLISLSLFFVLSKGYTKKNALPDIILSTTELHFNNSLSLIKKDGVWVSVADDNYPVDNDLVDDLLNDMYNSSLQAKKHTDDIWGNDEIILKTQNGDELKIYFDEVSGQTTELVAATAEGKVVMKGQFAIPSQPFEWFLQPLISVKDEEIEEIYGIDPQKLSFSNLIFYQATRSNDFTEWDNRKIKIVMKNGIVLNLTIYAQGHSYWISINPETTIMPTIAADDFIKNNKFLYDGWFFELPQPLGSRIFGN